MNDWVNDNTSISTVVYNNISSSNNTTDGSFSSCLQLHIPAEVKSILIAAHVVIFIVGVIGNLVAIYVIGIKNVNRKCFDIQIVGLAAADLIAAVTLPVVTIHDFLLDWSGWRLGGTVGCKIFLSIDHVTILVSTFILILISADRLRAIGSLRMISNTPTTVRCEIFMIWILALCVVSPYINSLSVQHGICHNWDWSPVQLFTYYAVYVNLSNFIPAIILISIYSISIYILSQKEIPGSEDKLFNTRRRKEFVKIMKMFCCIAILFFILTTPYAVVHFMVSYYGTFDLTAYCKNSRLLNALQYGFYTLSHFNCCVNPFIYAKMHNNMKRSLVKHVSSKWKAFTFTRKIRLSVSSINSHHSEQYHLVTMKPYAESPNLTVIGRH